MYKTIIIALIFLMFHVAAFGAEIRLLPGEVLSEIYDIKIQTTVSYESESGIYTYNYTVANPSSNTGAIDDIDIDIKKPADSVTLSREGLKYGQGYLRSSSEDIFARSTVPLIPVGLSAPKNWIAGLSVRGTAGWGAKKEVSRIYPGSFMSGFEMNSRGLPGIRQVTILPYFKQTPVPEATKENLERLKAIRKKITFTTKTIGPTAPPADFKPIPFLDYIISLKHEAYKFGWIIQGRDDDKDKYEDEEEGIMKSLDKKLEKAKAELVKGDAREAIEKLKSFIHEVEALYKEGKEEKHEKEEGHSHITSEAYALLKYNAVYLIEKLGGEWKDKNDKRD